MKETPSQSELFKEIPIANPLGQSILESVPQCLAVFSIKLRLVYANRKFIQFVKDVLGYELTPGCDITEAFPEDRALRWQMRLQEVLGRLPIRVEEVIEIDGETRYFDVCYEPMEAETDHGKVLVSFDEITARRRSEKRFREREAELEEAISTRETLLSVISHDLRSPVFQLNGLLFMIRQAADSRDESRLQMYAEDLEERISHLTHTIDNVLSWSSLQRQSLKPRISRFSLKPLLDHAIGLLKPVAQPKGVRIYSQRVRGLEIHSDQEMVAFILRNLINNAIKFSKQGGKIEISAEETGQYVSISVSDRGVGFTPGDICSVKEGRSVQSHAGTWGEHGTGIGLKTCYEFAERLDGKLEIVSALNEGTVATVRIPQLTDPG